MISILPNETDDEAFIEIVSQILNNLISATNPEEVYLVKIDHRFDYKWLAFSHKLLGAVGVWTKQNRIPPFIPDKVIEESFFQNKGGLFQQKPHYPLHIYQTSEANTNRLIKHRTDCGLFLWYSGDTKVSSQASIMVYSVFSGKEKSWFASFVNNKSWQIRGTQNISKSEINNLANENFSAFTS
jgi:hypothetical protein